MRLAIVGSRNFHDYQSFKTAVLKVLNGIKPEVIISGGCRGTDKMAEVFAKENSIEVLIFPADCEQFGKGGFLLRNTEIVNACTHMIAFPSRTGRGTQDSIRKAKDKILKILYVD